MIVLAAVYAPARILKDCAGEGAEDCASKGAEECASEGAEGVRQRGR